MPYAIYFLQNNVDIDQVFIFIVYFLIFSAFTFALSIIFTTLRLKKKYDLKIDNLKKENEKELFNPENKRLEMLQVQLKNNELVNKIEILKCQSLGLRLLFELKFNAKFAAETIFK